MADKRTYIRVHDGMPEHPKIEALSDKGFRLVMETWCWCSRNHTDGRVSAAVWAKRGTKKVRDELVAAGLVEVHDGFVQMHDYLEHQRSAEQIAKAVEEKKAGARLGNHRRWHRNGVIDPGCEYCPPMGPTHPDPSDDRSDMRSDDRSDIRQFRSPEDRGQITETDELTFTGNAAESNARAQPRRPRRPSPAELAATAHSPTAHRLVSTWANTCRRRPPSSLLGDLAVQVDALLAENWTPDELEPVIAAWGAKGVHPKVLPSVAHEVANAGTGPRLVTTKTSTTDQRVIAAQALKALYQQPADQPAIGAGT